MRPSPLGTFLGLALVLTPLAAVAQTAPGPMPDPASDNDPQPPVAQPGAAVGTVVQQAGVGGQVGYGRAGVLELGGSAGLTASRNFTRANVTPSIGWFLADNFELSGLVSFTYVSTDEGGEGSTASMTTALLEPSYHLPFSRTSFGFVGVGMGGAYVPGPGLGVALAPRLGAHVLVGRSGVLTPSVSWQYNTHDAMEVPQGVAVAVTTAATANVGYTVMW
jgi:hypothetical protein